MPRNQNVQIFGVGDKIGASDSYLVADLLPAELAASAFDKVKEEVKWQTMYHRGKLFLFHFFILCDIFE